MRAVTIKDIGKKLGINHSTVSRAINGDPRISVDTKRKVMDAVRDMKYTPNLAARGLIRGKSNTIAIITPSYFSNFSVDIMAGIEPEMIKTRYDVTYYTTSKYTTIGTQNKDSDLFAKILNERKADAVIVNGPIVGDPDILKRYKKAGIHIVYIEGKGDWGHRVHYDNQKAATMAVKYLADRGRKRIGLLVGNYEYVESMKERRDGYKKAMLDFTGKYDKDLTFSFYEDFGDACKNALMHFVDKKANAIYVATGDEDAIKVMAEAEKLGIKIPEDIAIIGQDDMKMAKIAGLTTIKQPISEMGKKAVELAVNAIEKNELKKMRDEIFYPELIIRKTTC